MSSIVWHWRVLFKSFIYKTSDYKRVRISKPICQTIEYTVGIESLGTSCINVHKKPRKDVKSLCHGSGKYSNTIQFEIHTSLYLKTVESYIGY